MMKRTISVFLTAALMLSVFAILPVTADAEETAQTGANAEIADTSASYSDDWQQWSQGASDYPLMRDVGCWVVAMSKLLRETGIAEEGLNPDDFYRWERENGWVPDSDDNLLQYDGENAPIAYAEEQGIDLEEVTVKENPSTDDLWSYINSGYYTIIAVKNYGHYVYLDNKTSKVQNDIYFMQSRSDLDSIGSLPLSTEYGSVNVAYVYKYDEYYQYQVLDDGTAEITGYSGFEGEITIPAYLGGYLVSSIGTRAFNQCDQLVSVNIPNTITNIGEFAFCSCTSLTSISLPDYITRINYGTFWNCKNLSSVTLPNSVTDIDHYAFYNCSKLTKITIPKDVTNIGESTFKNCSKLKTIIMPDLTASIGIHAFEDTEWFEDQAVGLVYAGKVAYRVKGQPSEIKIKKGTVRINDQAFLGSHNIESINIPNTVTSIGEQAFSNCWFLKSVSIPNSVTSIGREAFLACHALKSINLPDSITYIGDEAFYWCDALERVIVPGSVMNIGNKAFGYVHNSYTGETHLVNGFSIYGYGSSIAEVYAYTNDITFVEIADKTDGTTCIKAVVPADIDFKTEVINLTEEVVHSIMLNSRFGMLVGAYDISLMLYDEIVQPEAPVQVSIPCDNEKAHVYRRESDGSLTDMGAWFKNGFLTFFTDHFSTYILAVPEDEKDILGDADGDGEVALIDVTLIQRHCAQLPVNIDEDVLLNADVDSNGVIEVVDATFIQRHLANITVPYPIG